MKEWIDHYLSSPLKPLLLDSACGLELEMLRVTADGNLSKLPHPEGLGSPLFHPYFTKDFSDAQLEYTTKKYKSHGEALDALEELIAFAHRETGQQGEHFWPLSMPCKLPPFSPDQIAHFGYTEVAREKRLYRQGLMHRYGSDIQMISGIHYNFSFSDELFQTDFQARGLEGDLKSFTSERYLNVMRHFIESTYLFVYLFGASPTAHSSYGPLEKEYTYATSLRMSPLGYHSPYQCSLGLSYETIERFIETYEAELNTPCSAFKGIQEQLNDHILQNESELYVPIRAKGNIHCANSTLEIIKKCGISYLEARTLDLNPFENRYVAQDDLDFIRLFLIYALIKPSSLSDKELSQARQNQHIIALHGRDPNVELSSGESFKVAARRRLEEMRLVAKELGQEELIEKQLERVENPSLTISAKVLAEGDIVPFALKRSKAIAKHYENAPSNPELEALAINSLEEQEVADAKARFHLAGYQDLEKSTQAVIREALERHLKVEVLDRAENFIRISNSERSEIIKEATKTSKDTYICPLIMENKHLSKSLLQENGIATPESITFDQLDEAIAAYDRFKKKRVVIKPTTANYGEGIAFIAPHSKEEYERAVERAFEFSSSLLVEDHVDGDEFRFLVINGEVIGVVKRIPANVIGNGSDTIERLIEQKNSDPRNYKEGKSSIKLGSIELAYLEKQGLTPKSIPAQGERLFLRQNSNVSTGGDSIDMTDQLGEYFPIAIQAAKAAGAHICGVDILIDLNAPGEYAIIEINHNPMLALHEFPTEGKWRNCAKPLLDFLGF